VLESGKGKEKEHEYQISIDNNKKTLLISTNNRYGTFTVIQVFGVCKTF